jgi:predicted amidohydrolase
MRKLTVAAAQMGPIQRSDARAEVIERLVSLLQQAADHGAELVVFPEAALTPFFPHWLMESQDEVDAYFEKEPLPQTLKSVFEAARQRRVSFVIGYAELTPRGHHFNSEAFYDENGQEILHYRKIHLPGYRDPQFATDFENLEKRYFEVGNQGFGVADWHGTKVGLAICNDRRWAESYRVMALQGAELVCLGYNTPFVTAHLEESNHLTSFHNQLAMQAGAYQNAMWVVGVAKGGVEEGVDQLAESMIVSPAGEVVAMAETTGDEVVMADIDLDLSRRYREHLFNFNHHRRPEAYWNITAPIPEGLRQE